MADTFNFTFVKSLTHLQGSLPALVVRTSPVFSNLPPKACLHSRLNSGPAAFAIAHARPAVIIIIIEGSN